MFELARSPNELIVEYALKRISKINILIFLIKDQLINNWNIMDNYSMISDFFKFLNRPEISMKLIISFQIRIVCLIVNLFLMVQ